MTSKAAQRTEFSLSEEAFPLYFNEWIKCRRKELDLTQDQLAKRSYCSVFTIRKIEMGERRPSRQLAGLLGKALEIPNENQTNFIKVARGELSVDFLRSITSGRGLQPTEQLIPSPGNLPRELTPFIGREPELTALKQLISDPGCSLLTLIGPGGIGKTRLAVEAAHYSEQLFPDGAWFIPFVSLNSPVQIIPAIADALDIKFQEPTNLQAQLIRFLGKKRALLVLDNVEHLMDGVGVFTEILKGCQQVKLLVTSRERLNLLSEWVFDLQGLPVPPNDQVEQFETYSSVALFLQSARRVRAGFELREAERRWVLNICRTMEGMPLGIELSAAWVGLLSCEEIAKEIEHNLDFLSVSMRDLPERHRSLRATLDHSWNLLNDEEKLIFSRLSVFHGSFNREAAQTICKASLAVLASLMNKTLLYRNEQAYYSLHEFVRQYASLKLAELHEEQEWIKEQHAMYYVQCLSEWEKALKSSRQMETFDQMTQVIENLSVGWQHMVAYCRPGIEKSNPLCADLIHKSLFSLSLFFEMRCRSLEAIALFQKSVAYLHSVRDDFDANEDSPRFFSVLGHITGYLGLHHVLVHQYGKGKEYLEEAIQWIEKGKSRIERAQVQVMLAAVKSIFGQLQESVTLLAQSQEIFREEGDDWWYILSIINQALYYNSLGKFQESEALYQEGFQFVAPGDLRLGLSLRTGYACLLYLKNDFASAEQWMHENLQLSHQLGNLNRTAANLFNLGRVGLATHKIELAEEYFRKSINLLGGFGELFDLTMLRIYLGKCYSAQGDYLAARDQFRQAIKFGKDFDLFHLVYWGLVNIAKTFLDEGQLKQALKISLALRRCATEFYVIQEDFTYLLDDLQAVLPEGEIEAAIKQVEGDLPADQAKAYLLAFAREFEHE